MTLKAVWLVAAREYREHLGTKTFWIGIFFVPLILALSIFGPIWLSDRSDVRRYAVIDKSGWLLPAIDRKAAADDLALVLRWGLQLHRAGGAAFDSLPHVLRNSVQLMATLAEQGGEGATATKAESSGEAKLIEALAGTASEWTPDPAAGAALAAADHEGRVPEVARKLGDWWNALTPVQARRLNVQTSKAQFLRVAAGTTDPRQLNLLIADGELFAYVTISDDPVAADAAGKYVSNNVTDESLLTWFRSAAGEAIRQRRMAREAIDPQVVQWIQRPAPFEVHKISSGGEEVVVDRQDVVRQWAPAAMSYFLWFAVFAVSQMLLTNTIEEKASRIIEVLLSSISPIELMAGKILGIAMTGLTVLTSWILSLLAAAFLLPQTVGQGVPLDLTPVAGDPFYMTSFLVYFLLGYFFYSALLVGIGSVCNTLKEAQNLMMPVSVLMLVPLLTLVPISKDPNGALARVLSFFPPFTPFVMMNRAAGPPLLWEYVGTTLLLGLSILGLFWVASKIFRIGVLMTAKRPSAREIWRVMRSSANG